MAAVMNSQASVQKTVLAACPHDCPDTCSMIVTVENDRVVKVRGNPDHPFTDGRLCVKVNHYEERVHHPDRVLYPLKRSGAKGSGEFTRISWQAALDEIAKRWKEIVQTQGPDRDPALQLSRYRGDPQRPERRRRILQQTGRDDLRADVLRLGRVYGLHDDRWPLAGNRSGELRSFPLHHPLGVQYHQHKSASLAVHRRGPEARSQDRRGRSGEDAHRASG